MRMRCHSRSRHEFGQLQAIPMPASGAAALPLFRSAETRIKPPRNRLIAARAVRIAPIAPEPYSGGTVKPQAPLAPPSEPSARKPRPARPSDMLPGDSDTVQSRMAATCRPARCSRTILMQTSSGTVNRAPMMPQIQNQKIRETKMRSGLSVRRQPTAAGVIT